MNGVTRPAAPTSEDKAPTVTTDRWCRCPDPLPPKTEQCALEWKCSVCGGERRYMEKISVQNGGIVGRCGQCRWDARRKPESERSVPDTLCRFLTCTTQLAGEMRERNSYYMCDSCIDEEIARNPNADVVDGRSR